MVTWTRGQSDDTLRIYNGILVHVSNLLVYNTTTPLATPSYGLQWNYVDDVSAI